MLREQSRFVERRLVTLVVSNVATYDSKAHIYLILTVNYELKVETNIDEPG